MQKYEGQTGPGFITTANRAVSLERLKGLCWRKALACHCQECWKKQATFLCGFCNLCKGNFSSVSEFEVTICLQNKMLWKNIHFVYNRHFAWPVCASCFQLISGSVWWDQGNSDSWTLQLTFYIVHTSCFWFSSVSSECSSCDIYIPMFLIHSMTTGNALVKIIFVADWLPALQPYK